MQRQLERLAILAPKIEECLKQLRQLAVKFTDESSTIVARQNLLFSYAGLLHQLRQMTAELAALNHHLHHQSKSKTTYLTDEKYQARREYYDRLQQELQNDIQGNQAVKSHQFKIDQQTYLAHGKNIPTSHYILTYWGLPELEQHYAILNGSQLINPETVSQYAASFNSLAKSAVANITEAEWLKPSKYGKPEHCPNMVKATDTANQMTYFVTSSILRQTDLSARTVALEFWVKVAYQCLQNGDYFSAGAITDALNLDPIARLVQTKAGIAAQQELQELLTLFSIENDFKNLKQAQETKAVIPSLVSLRKDMVIAFEKLDQLNQRNGELISKKVIETLTVSAPLMPPTHSIKAWQAWAEQQLQNNNSFAYNAVNAGFNQAISHNMQSSWASSYLHQYLSHLTGVVEQAAHNDNKISVAFNVPDTATSVAELKKQVKESIADAIKAKTIVPILYHWLELSNELQLTQTDKQLAIVTAIHEQIHPIFKNIASSPEHERQLLTDWYAFANEFIIQPETSASVEESIQQITQPKFALRQIAFAETDVANNTRIKVKIYHERLAEFHSSGAVTEIEAALRSQQTDDDTTMGFHKTSQSYKPRAGQESPTASDIMAQTATFSDLSQPATHIKNKWAALRRELNEAQTPQAKGQQAATLIAKLEALAQMARHYMLRLDTFAAAAAKSDVDTITPVIEEINSTIQELEKPKVLWTCYGRHDESLINLLRQHSTKIKALEGEQHVTEDVRITDGEKLLAILKVSYRYHNDTISIINYQVDAYNDRAINLIDNFKQKIIAGEVETRIPLAYATAQLGLTQKQLVKGNTTYFKSSSLAEQLARDIRTLQATINPATLDATQPDYNLERRRQLATERVLQSTALGGLRIRTNKKAAWQSASETQFPVAMYASHGGRVIKHMDNQKAAIAYLCQVFQAGNPNDYASVEDWLKQHVSLKTDDPNAAKKSEKLLYMRKASTHTTEQLSFDKVELAEESQLRTTKEIKSRTAGLRSLATVIRNQVTGNEELTWNFGMTLAVGGKGNIAPDGSVIDSDERSGHLFLGVTVHDDGSVSMMEGFEPSGPGSHRNVFGESHSNFGNPGKFSPTGGLKLPKGKAKGKAKAKAKATPTVWDDAEKTYGAKAPGKHDCMEIHFTDEKLGQWLELSQQQGQLPDTQALLSQPAQSSQHLQQTTVAEKSLALPASFSYEHWLRFSKFNAKTPLDNKLNLAIDEYCKFKVKDDYKILLNASLQDLPSQEQHNLLDKLVSENNLSHIYVTIYPHVKENLLGRALEQTRRWLLSNPKHSAVEKVKILHTRLLIDKVNMTFNYYQLFNQQLASDPHEQLVVLSNLEQELLTYQADLALEKFNLTDKQYLKVAGLIDQFLEKTQVQLKNNAEYKGKSMPAKEPEKPQAQLTGALNIKQNFAKSHVAEIVSFITLKIQKEANKGDKQAESDYKKFESLSKKLYKNHAGLQKADDVNVQNKLLAERFKLLNSAQKLLDAVLQHPHSHRYDIYITDKPIKLGDVCRMKFPKAALGEISLKGEHVKRSPKINLAEAIANELKGVKKMQQQVSQPQQNTLSFVANLSQELEQSTHNTVLLRRLFTALSTCGLAGNATQPLYAYFDKAPIHINFDKPTDTIAFLDYLSQDSSNIKAIQQLTEQLKTRISNHQPAKATAHTLDSSVAKESADTSLVKSFFTSLIPDFIKQWWSSLTINAAEREPLLKKTTGNTPNDPLTLTVPIPSVAQSHLKLVIDENSDKCSIKVHFELPESFQQHLPSIKEKEIRIDAQEIAALKNKTKGFCYQTNMLSMPPISSHVFHSKIEKTSLDVARKKHNTEPRLSEEAQQHVTKTPGLRATGG